MSMLIARIISLLFELHKSLAASKNRQMKGVKYYPRRLIGMAQIAANLVGKLSIVT